MYVSKPWMLLGFLQPQLIYLPPQWFSKFHKSNTLGYDIEHQSNKKELYTCGIKNQPLEPDNPTSTCTCTAGCFIA